MQETSYDVGKIFVRYSRGESGEAAGSRASFKIVKDFLVERKIRVGIVSKLFSFSLSTECSLSPSQDKMKAAQKSIMFLHIFSGFRKVLVGSSGKR